MGRALQRAPERVQRLVDAAARFENQRKAPGEAKLYPATPAASDYSK
jgi:hypothetical protein